MTDEPREALKTTDHSLSQTVGNKAHRKLIAQRNKAPGIWFGLGMMGIIGLSVTIPTLLGAALGLWLDGHYPSDRSWTLILLVAGITLGCFNAWHWVSQEDQAIANDEAMAKDETLGQNEENRDA